MRCLFLVCFEVCQLSEAVLVAVEWHENQIAESHSCHTAFADADRHVRIHSFSRMHTDPSLARAFRQVCDQKGCTLGARRRGRLAHKRAAALHVPDPSCSWTLSSHFPFGELRERLHARQTFDMLVAATQAHRRPFHSLHLRSLFWFSASKAENPAKWHMERRRRKNRQARFTTTKKSSFALCHFSDSTFVF